MPKTKQDKLRKQLKAAQRRRGRRPAPSVTASVALKASGSLKRRLVRDYQDVLQNIEAMLVAAAREATDVDDHVVERALRLAIRQQDSSEEPIVEWVLNSLGYVRDQRDDISDDVWRDALRVVYASLKTHSTRTKGELSYLEFVARYIP